MRLVLASNNGKKLQELAVLLGGLPIELVAQGALGVTETDEPHITFVENALRKARHAARCSGLAAIADDSGLCVDALGGAPGVASAHFAPMPDGAADGDADKDAAREIRRAAQDQANNALLLHRLQGAAAAEQRRATFVSTLVALRHADDPQPLLAFGRWQGSIAVQPAGAMGFGYDPLMFIAELGCTVAQLDAATKNRHSHRALAAAQMLALLKDAWHLG